jgi:hypothetical protein
MQKVTGIIVKSRLFNNEEAEHEVLEINDTYAKVRIGDRIYATTDPDYTTVPDPGYLAIGRVLDRVLSHVLGDEYSGYVHNYSFKDNAVYEAEGPFSG